MSDLSFSEIAGATARREEESTKREVNELCGLVATGMYPRPGKRAEYMTDVSKFSLEAVERAARMINEFYFVQYGACTRGCTIDERFRALHVATRELYVARKRAGIKSHAKHGPLLMALVLSFGVIPLAVFSQALPGAILPAVACALYLAGVIGYAARVRRRRMSELPGRLALVKAPAEPVNEDVEWALWRDYHDRGCR